MAFKKPPGKKAAIAYKRSVGITPFSSGPSYLPAPHELELPEMPGSGPSVLPGPIGDYDMSGFSIGPTGIGGVNIGAGGFTVGGTIGGIPIGGSFDFPWGSEPTSGGQTPGNFNKKAAARQGLVAQPSSGPCPGLMSVRDPITGNCIDLTALPPGGDPAMTGPVMLPQGGSDGYGPAVMGFFGVGLVPRVEVQTVRRCPPGMQLGRDGVCYDGLPRNSAKRAHPLGIKPLMTGGDRAAIARAKRVAGSLARARKSLKQTGKAFDKAGC